MSQDLLEKAVIEVAERLGKKNGISPSKQAVLQSSQRIVRDAYEAVLQMQRDMSKSPTAAELPDIPHDLDADTVAGLEKLRQRLLANDEQRNARHHASLLETDRGFLMLRFRQIGVSNETANELAKFVCQH